jgi:hypothetical protein
LQPIAALEQVSIHMTSKDRASTSAGIVEALAHDLSPEQRRILVHALTGDESQDEVVFWAAMWGSEGG